LLEDLERELGELQSTNKLVEGTVAELQQKLQKEKVCHAIDYQYAEHVNAVLW